MFDTLSDRLGSVFDRLKGRGALSEQDVRDAMRTSSVAPGKPMRTRPSPRPLPGSSKSTPGVMATPASERSASQRPSESVTPWAERSTYM